MSIDALEKCPHCNCPFELDVDEEGIINCGWCNWDETKDWVCDE